MGFNLGARWWVGGWMVVPVWWLRLEDGCQEMEDIAGLVMNFQVDQVQMDFLLSSGCWLGVTCSHVVGRVYGRASSATDGTLIPGVYIAGRHIRLQ